jgi:hypothetical protein
MRPSLLTMMNIHANRQNNNQGAHQGHTESHDLFDAVIVLVISIASRLFVHRKRVLDFAIFATKSALALATRMRLTVFDLGKTLAAVGTKCILSNALERLCAVHGAKLTGNVFTTRPGELVQWIVRFAAIAPKRECIAQNARLGHALRAIHANLIPAGTNIHFVFACQANIAGWTDAVFKVFTIRLAESI